MIKATCIPVIPVQMSNLVNFGEDIEREMVLKNRTIDIDAQQPRKRQRHATHVDTDREDADDDINKVEIVPNALERYHMLALGRFYKDEDIHELQKKCRQGMWTIGSLKKALFDLDTADPINEFESRDIVHVKEFLSKSDVESMNNCFNIHVRKSPFQAGTDSGSAASWCKYLYVKSRKDRDIYPEFRIGFSDELQKRIHNEVIKTLTSHERNCFGEFFPQEKAREISIVVSYDCSNSKSLFHVMFVIALGVVSALSNQGEGYKENWNRPTH